jgi:hypothetical protein
MLNIISTQARQSLESSDPLVVPELYEHISLSLLSSLTNETDPLPFILSFTLDRILEPSFLLPSENVPISNRHITEERRKFVEGNDDWGAGLHPLGIMLEKTQELLSYKLGEKDL